MQDERKLVALLIYICRKIYIIYRKLSHLIISNRTISFLQCPYSYLHLCGSDLEFKT